MIELKTTRLGAIEFRYAESPGPNPTILFLHGVTDSLEGYLGPMAEMDGAFHLFALDFRGHGLSGHAKGRYRILDHAGDVEAFLSAIIGHPAILAGHSLGALVAGYLAASAPQVVHGAFLEDPPLFVAQMPRMRETTDYQIFFGLRELLRHHKDSGESVQELANAVGAWPIHPLLFDGKSLLDVAGPEVVNARAQSLHGLDVAVLDPVLDGSQFEGFNPDHDMRRIRCPVRVLAGEMPLGGAMDQKDLDHLREIVPELSYRVLPGVGHFIHHTALASYVEELRTFAEKLR